MAQKDFDNKLKLLIFWKDNKDIEENMRQFLLIANNYSNMVNFIFITDIENFIQKKKFLIENNYYRVIDDKIEKIENNIYYIFDEKFM